MSATQSPPFTNSRAEGLYSTRAVCRAIPWRAGVRSTATPPSASTSLSPSQSSLTWRVMTKRAVSRDFQPLFFVCWKHSTLATYKQAKMILRTLMFLQRYLLAKFEICMSAMSTKYLRENEKFRNIVLVCSYGAPIEFFEQKGRNLVPLSLSVGLPSKLSPWIVEECAAHDDGQFGRPLNGLLWNSQAKWILEYMYNTLGCINFLRWKSSTPLCFPGVSGGQKHFFFAPKTKSS